MVSVIIVNYNTFQLTCNCIASIYEKELDDNLEIILVDNASIECNPILFKQRFPKVILIENNKNSGFAAGNNLGISIATGDYILLLNSDTVLINNAITIARKIMANNTDIGVLSGQLQFPDGRLQAVAWPFPSLTNIIIDFLRISKLYGAKRKKCFYQGQCLDYTIAHEVDWVWGAFFMLRKSDTLLFPEQKLHEDFFMYGEDMQWCYYFRKKIKKKIYYSPEPKVVHFIGGSDFDQQTVFNKYKTKILPNEYRWLRVEHGLFVARFYYLVRALHLFTVKGRKGFNEIQEYLKLFISGI